MRSCGPVGLQARVIDVNVSINHHFLFEVGVWSGATSEDESAFVSQLKKRKRKRKRKYRPPVLLHLI